MQKKPGAPVFAAICLLGMLLCGLPAGAITERTQLIGSDTRAQDLFGVEVQASGDRIIVGAHLHDIGNQVDVGAAYIYHRCGSAWVEEAKLIPPDGRSDDFFAWTVSISGDVAIMGAHGNDNARGQNAGAAYIYRRMNGTWTLEAKLTASDGAAEDQFGWDVWISGDTAMVGAVLDDVGTQADAGSAYVFTRESGTWRQQAKLSAPTPLANGQFGRGVSVSGNSVAVGAAGYQNPNGEDRAYVFTRSNDVWSLQATLQAPDATGVDHFGLNIAISGDTLIVGSERHDVDGMGDAGASYIFVRNGSNWTLQTKLTASDAAQGDRFGFCAELVGDYAVVGAIFGTTEPGVRNGKVYVYKRTGTTWDEIAILQARVGSSQDQFGNTVAIQDDLIIVGAVRDNMNGLVDSGSAYIFQIGTQPPTITQTYPARGTTYPGGIVTLEVLNGICGTPVPLDVVVADVDGNFLSQVDTLPYVGWYLRGNVITMEGDTSDFSVPVLIESPCLLPATPNTPTPPDGEYTPDQQVTLSWNGLISKSAEKDWVETTVDCASPLDLDAVAPPSGQFATWDGDAFANAGVSFAPVPGGYLYLGRDPALGPYLMSSFSTGQNPDANAPVVMNFPVPATCVSLLINDPDGGTSPWAVIARDAGGAVISQQVNTALQRRVRLEAPGIAQVAFYPSADQEIVQEISFVTVDCPVVYDVYFGTSPVNMTLLCEDLATTSCQTPVLTETIPYYWQVIGKTTSGNAEGPVWQFTRRPGVTPRNDRFEILEDSPTVLLDVLANDSSPGPIQIVSHTEPAFGTLILRPDNLFAYTAPPNFNGAVDFLYKIPNSGSGFWNVWVDVIVLPVNDAPYVNVPVPDLSVATNGGPLGLNAGLLFRDVDAGDTLDYTVAVNSNPGLVNFVRSGAGFAIYIAPGQNGVATITLRATDTGGLFAEETFTVTVGTPATPPVITQQPVPQAINYQQDTQFTCAATSNVSLSFQWQRNGVDLVDGPKYSGAITPQLLVFAGENADEGNYRCRISNGSTTVFTQNAALTVRDPYIAGGPDDTTGGPGGTASFEVSALGSGTLAYQWFIGNTPLAEGAKYTGATGPRLTVNNLVDFPNNTDEQLYRCEVRGADPGAVRSRAAWLTISDPAIITHPTPLTVREGTNAQFRIVAIGTPPLIYRWRKNGVSLEEGGRFSGTRTPVLSITGALEEDEADYHCIAVGQEAVNSRSARLTVTQLPQITGIQVTPASGIVSRGAPFSVEVLLDGPTDGLSFAWERDGIPVADDGRIGGSATALLTVSSANDGDEGRYFCTVSKDNESLTSPPGQVRVGLAFAVDLPDVSAENGERLLWGAVVTGEVAPVTYSWFRQRDAKAFEPVRDDGRVVGSETSSLTFNPVEFDDAGLYTVYALDGVDIAVSRIATLTVLAQLPVAGMAGLAALAAVLGAAGAWRRGRGRG